MATVKITRKQAAKLGLKSAEKQVGVACSGGTRVYTMNARGAGNYKFGDKYAETFKKSS